MEWKQVIGFEGLYIVSENGNVLSLGNGCSTNTLTKNERHLTQRLSRNGYLNVKLSKQGERTYISVHRLVALSFIPNPEKKPQVNHKDGNKSNNSIGNLEYLSPSDNQRHAIATGLKRARRGIESHAYKHGRSAQADYKKTYLLAYRLANRDKILAQKKASYYADKDRHIAYSKAYKLANRDKILIQRKARYLAKKNKTTTVTTNE